MDDRIKGGLLAVAVLAAPFLLGRVWNGVLDRAEATQSRDRSRVQRATMYARELARLRKQEELLSRAQKKENRILRKLELSRRRQARRPPVTDIPRD